MKKTSLTSGWQLKGYDKDNISELKLKDFDMEDSMWIPVKVPGDVHSALMQQGIIEDPFYSTNAEKCRWVEDKIWVYRTRFAFNEEIQNDEVIELVFQGLDTFATVYLNGQKLGIHSNMFIPFKVDITPFIQYGINEVLISFDSVITVTERKDYSKMWFSYSRNRVWARKAQMNFRWDWGPRLLTAGIWKEVELQCHKKVSIDYSYFTTTHLSCDRAEVSLDIGLKQASNKRLKVKIDMMEEEKSVYSQEIKVDENNPIHMTFEVNHPKLWWTHDLGEPFLYDLRIELFEEDRLIDTKVQKVGIRQLEIQQKDEAGNSRFMFVLNGVGVFVKGANWVPAHSLIGTIDKKTYVDWIQLAKEGNMNMLRIWGGGIYEKEIFYETCDASGILIWQDFMFTCSSYPDFDFEFMSNVKAEIRYIVKALRNHPSLAIWCGNNEIQWLHGQKLPQLVDLRLYGEKIYHDLMPEILQELDPSRLYWPSSPFGGNDPNSDEQGDKHNWQVWAGQIYPRKYGEPVLVDNSPHGISFKRFAEDMCKFASEFGMHALPVMETLEACIPKEDLYFDSFEMKYRNKDKRPDRGKLLMEGYTGLPHNLEEYIDFSMMAQAEGLKYGIEHYRRRWPECGGSIIWQLNDCWPTMSWSIADFFGRPKAGYYYTKRVYKPIIISFKEETLDYFSLWVSNDTCEIYEDTLIVGLQDFFGHNEYYEEVPVYVKPKQSLKIKVFFKNRINVTYANFEFMYVKSLEGKVDQNILFFYDYKDLNLPPCTLDVRKEVLSEQEIKLKIKTDCFAKFVKIAGDLDGIKLSDNYFDLMPNEEKEILLWTQNPKIVDLKITVQAINNRTK
ncbi:beta-mannosidase [Cellulosilyticum sp. I15G10I2]|uniref:beta-mannosidase n=1 Tax=Cellulosilyticum sp. I15G10I2 TaxID=1892843 RepID=UPI00085C19A3|nr:sugar-binding domain-containing protein [Cellulosilyticum sp. I15G10I2]